MLDQETKRKIDSARQILVGKVPDPKAQVEQITTALIYKFMDDMDKENVELGGKPRFFIGDIKEYSWSRLLSRELSGQERLDLYVRALGELSRAKEIPELFRTIFKDAFLPYRDPETLNLFLKEISSFTYENSENLGNAFEYLLSVLGSQGDAGQFRTPRHIIDFIVEVVDPKKNEKILDPACGTAGFLISSYKHIKRMYSSNFSAEEYVQTFVETDNRDITTVEIQKNGKYKGDLLTPDDRKKLAQNIVGYDISPDMVRLSLVNLYLHGFNSPQIFEYDSLTYEDRWDDTFDVILANPPFMTPKGGIRPHKRFQIQANRAEVLFVDYIAEHLKNNGRAGIIVPEGIIFQSNAAYRNLRKMLVDDGYLWAVVSLPSGVFNPYSGVKTSVLFLDKELAKKSDEILFVKIENDGFDLGAQRRRIEQNDLPNAFEIIQKFKQVIRGEKKGLTYGDVCGIAQTIKKHEVIESGDYDLSGEKYRKDVDLILRESLDRITTSLKPYEGMFEKFAKQSNVFQKQIEDIQNSIKPFLTYLSEQQEIINELYAHLSEPIRHIQKAFESSMFKSALEAVESVRKMVQGGQYPMVKLSDIAELHHGVTFSKKDQVYSEDADTIRVATTKAAQSDGIVENDLYFIPKRLVKSDNLIVRDGDILISIANSLNLLGRVTYVKTLAEPVTFGAFMGMIRVKKDKVLPELLYHYLKSNRAIEYFRKNAKTTTNISNINFSTLSNFEIPLPSLDVQKQIVEQIEVKQNAIDAAREVIRNLERERRYFGQELRKIDDIPMIELGKLCTFEYGKALKEEDRQNGEYPVFGSNGIVGWHNEYLVNGPFVVIGRKGTAGAVTYSEKSGFPIDTTFYIRLMKTEKVDLKFLYYILGTIGLDKVNTQAGVPGLNRNDAYKIKIPLPPLDVQKRMVEEMEKEEDVLTINCRLIETMQKKIFLILNEI